MPTQENPQLEIKKIQKLVIEPNEFLPSDSFHEPPTNQNLELMKIKGK
jgi:hypothetical protein